MGYRYCVVLFILSHVYVQISCIDSSVVKFKRTLTNITAIEGGMVVLRCQFTNGVGLRRTWTNGTSVIYADEAKYSGDKRISLELNTGQEYSIQLQRVTAYDEGTYTCTVYSAPVKTMSVYLTVNVPAQFTSEVSPDITLTEGGKTVLTCVATGKPKPQITWRHLVPSADGVMGTGFHLPLSGITRQGQGIYECTADNKIAAPVTHRIRVAVKYPPEMLSYRKVKKEVSAALGQEAVLECSASGHPRPQFTWKHLNYVYEEKKLGSGVDVLVVSRGNTVRSKLIIESVSQKDFGEYVCIGKNEMGSANGTVRLLQVIPEPTRPNPIVYFPGEDTGGSHGNSAKSEFTFSRLFAVLSPFLGAKLINMFGN